jgi:hypothetical protein
MVRKPCADATDRIPDLDCSGYTAAVQESRVRKAAPQDLRRLAAQQAALAVQLFAGELEAF